MATAALVIGLAAPAVAQPSAVSTTDPTTAIASSPSVGFWTVTQGGHVKAFENATNHGSLAHPSHPIVAIGAGTTGYWLVGRNGGVAAKGAPGNYGHPRKVTKRIVSIAVTSDRHGYWLIGADGNIYPEGDAVNYGSTVGIRLNSPIVSAVGTVYPFGDAIDYGHPSLVTSTIVGAAITPDGRGYRLVGSDGAVYPFGDG